MISIKDIDMAVIVGMNDQTVGMTRKMKNEMFYGRSWIGVTMDDFVNELNSYINWYNKNE